MVAGGVVLNQIAAGAHKVKSINVKHMEEVNDARNLVVIRVQEMVLINVEHMAVSDVQTA